MTREERNLALYCLKASSDYHSEVCEECIKYPNCDHMGQDDVTETIIKALEQEPKKWIPVSERLPEANGRYYVTRGLNACGALWNRVYIVNYSDLMGLKSERIWWEGNVGKSDFERFDDVLAWMPLPEPYKAESEDKECRY